jgi:hypothetical protein
MSWHLECSEISEAIKHPAVDSDITNFFFMKQCLFKNAETFVQNNISTFCQIADQLLQQNNERYCLVFNYVVFIDFYESSFCWQFRNF